MSKKKVPTLILKIAPLEWKNASRDKRELGVMKELGANVLVLAKGKQTGVIEQIDGFKVYRVSTRPLGKHIPNTINRIVSIFTWAWHAKKISPEVISGHNIAAVFIGYLSMLFVSKKKRPKLVYDSHEFEIGSNMKRNKLQVLAITYLERFLIKKCAFTIVVNDSIADELQKVYKLKQRPIVVRNIPEYWSVNETVCLEMREKILENFIDPQKVLLSYHGMVGTGRGIETLIKVIKDYEDACLLILGDVLNHKYLESLKQMAVVLGVDKRILFHPSVPIKELWKYVGAAHISMVTIPPVTKSYYYALPNKLFESIQALTPMIISDLPEMKRVIKKYKIGLISAPDDVKEIVRCIDCMMQNKTQYNMFKENLKIAKEELCWEKEKKVLLEAYSAII